MMLRLSSLHIVTSADIFQSTEAATGGVFANFTGKHMCWSFFESRLRRVTLLK